MGLKAMDRGGMVVTALRFATACGMSSRLRLDLVLNALSPAPWRPLIHVNDMARAIDWAVHRSSDQGGDFLGINTGSDGWNYQVRDLAQAVAELVPRTKVSINTNAPPDRRSYSVDFALYRELAPQHQLQVTLKAAIEGLRDGLETMGFRDQSFRNSQFMRLKVLERHMSEGRLGWRSHFDGNSSVAWKQSFTAKSLRDRASSSFPS